MYIYTWVLICYHPKLQDACMLGSPSGGRLVLREARLEAGSSYARAVWHLIDAELET